MKTCIEATTILDKLLQMLSLTKDVQLAEFLGVSAQAIYQARKKNKVPDGWLIRAAHKGGVSIDVLLSLAPIYNDTPAAHTANAKTRDVFSPSVEAIGAGQGAHPFDENFCTVPLVAAKLSAGGGSLETEGDIIERLAFRKNWLSRRGAIDKMILMRVYGDSMEPYIQDGDLTLIDTSRKNIIPHTVYAVGVDDGIYVKSLETLPGQRLILRSFNERYAPIEIDMRGDLAESVRIIGKVIWWCHEA